MGALQSRIGPNKVGYIGILQPIADGQKQIQKETVIPKDSNGLVFMQAPFVGFTLALQNWVVMPLGEDLYQVEVIGGSLLIIIGISEQSIYSVLLSGWGSNSKYPFIGSIRSTAQMISYSIAISLMILAVIFITGTVNIVELVGNRIPNIYLPVAIAPCVILFIIAAIAETNRGPFDLPEAESELVAGFMVEYSAVSFSFFYLAEYTNILVISTLFPILFMGLAGSWVSLILIFIMVWVRASLPRLRIDQLQSFGWAYLLPFLMSVIIFIPVLLNI